MNLTWRTFDNIRTGLAKLYQPEDFGPVKALNQDEKVLVSRGKTRIRDKVRSLKKLFRESKKKNTRSGAGRVETENWETLVFLWDGSPAVDSLPHGKRSADPDSEGDNDDENIEENEAEDDIENESNENDENRKKTLAIVDEKRKMLGKKLSANQRDQIYLNLAREDMKVKEKMITNMMEETKTIANSIEKMADAMKGIGSSLENGLGLLAAALSGNSTNNRPTNYPQYGFNLPTHPQLPQQHFQHPSVFRNIDSNQIQNGQNVDSGSFHLNESSFNNRSQSF